MVMYMDQVGITTNRCMSVSLLKIFDDFSGTGLLVELKGSDVEVRRIYSVVNCGPGDLVFVEDKKYLESVKKGQPAAMVVPPKLLEEALKLNIPFLVSPNVKLAHALLKQRYDDRDLRHEQWEQVHSSAVVHATAKVPASCFIGPNAVIGENVQMGENCRIMAGVVIEHSATIGANCIVFPNAVIGYGTEIGNDVEIGSCSVIGSEGFGFAQDQKRKSHRLPQTGIVKIEDRVRLGANNTVDRAAYGLTRVGAGTKTDNLCHIGHGAEIGEDCLMAMGFGVAGSTVIGDRLMASGQTGILDHLQIPSDTVLVHRAAVLQSIDKPGIYASNPATPLQQYLRNTAVFKDLHGMSKRLRELEKELQALKGENKN